MEYQQLIDSMTPDIYRRMQNSIELGKWPDGRAMTAAQREHTLQALIAWGERHLSESERIGYIPPKTIVADACEPASEAPVETPLKWQDEELK